MADIQDSRRINDTRWPLSILSHRYGSVVDSDSICTTFYGTTFTNRIPPNYAVKFKENAKGVPGIKFQYAGDIYGAYYQYPAGAWQCPNNPSNDFRYRYEFSMPVQLSLCCQQTTLRVEPKIDLSAYRALPTTMETSSCMCSACSIMEITTNQLLSSTVSMTSRADDSTTCLKLIIISDCPK